MARISSFGQQQQLIRSIQQNQERVFTAQRQIATGKKTDDFQGLAGEINTILGTESFKNRIGSYQRSIATVRGKVDANDVQISGMLNVLEDLREAIQVGLANNQVEGFQGQLGQAFQFVANALNTNLDGTFLFSGAKTGTPPVNIQSLADLDNFVNVGGNPMSDVFDNASVAFQARVADGVDVQFGLLASDLAGDAFQDMLDLYSDVNAPDSGVLTTAQFSFMKTKLADIEATIDSLRQKQVSNGLIFNRLDEIDQQHEDSVVFLEQFIADMEDVDIAEAVTRLNNDQVALEASFRAVSSLQNLTLLNFL